MSYNWLIEYLYNLPTQKNSLQQLKSLQINALNVLLQPSSYCKIVLHPRKHSHPHLQSVRKQPLHLVVIDQSLAIKYIYLDQIQVDLTGD